MKHKNLSFEELRIYANERVAEKEIEFEIQAERLFRTVMHQLARGRFKPDFSKYAKEGAIKVRFWTFASDEVCVRAIRIMKERGFNHVDTTIEYLPFQRGFTFVLPR